MKKQVIISKIKELERRKGTLSVEISMREREKQRMEIALKQIERDLKGLYKEL